MGQTEPITPTEPEKKEVRYVLKPIVLLVPLTCPECKQELGKLREIDGKVFLLIGNWVVSSAKCHCHICGSTVHFQAPKKTIKELEHNFHINNYKLIQVD